MTKYNCLQCKEVFSVESANDNVRFCPFCGGIKPLTDSEEKRGERVNRKIIEEAH